MSWGSLTELKVPKMHRSVAIRAPSSDATTKLLVVTGTWRSGLRKTSAVRVPIAITPKTTKIRNERS
jgi:hypothetical protein